MRCCRAYRGIRGGYQNLEIVRKWAGCKQAGQMRVMNRQKDKPICNTRALDKLICTCKFLGANCVKETHASFPQCPTTFYKKSRCLEGAF
jgi:hypothetical protein